jgi:hypothetical protein
MPLDTNLLYGASVATGLVHLALPFGLSLIASRLGHNIWILLVLLVIVSFLVQLAAQTGLQAQSCDGVKDFRSIAAGATLGSIVVGVMALIPILIQPMRLVVSQFAGRHTAAMTPEQRENNQILAAASLKIVRDNTVDPSVAANALGLDNDAFADQTFREQHIGMGYWAAFGGAYGVGLGSLIAAVCPATA